MHGVPSECGHRVAFVNRGTNNSMSRTVISKAGLDRLGLVRRHNPVVHQADPLTPLSVGNGRFAFTMDVTGLQTFPDFYAQGIPLSIQSQWGWHTFPNPINYRLADTIEEFDVYGRPVGYPTNSRSAAGQWLRSNPHRLGLGRIGFEFKQADGSKAGLSDLDHIEQTLDLWSGQVTSRFEVSGRLVRVWTSCHPESDMIAVRVESELVAEGRLTVVFNFPYGSGASGKEPGDWAAPERHVTTIMRQVTGRVDLLRNLDADSYRVSAAYSEGGAFKETARHRYELAPGRQEPTFEFAAAFSPQAMPSPLPNVNETERASTAGWHRFWSTGGALDLSGSADPRAQELERRIVLSQYLTAIQCSGALPPQETGLTCNSWYGKFHLEMHWWHGVHFALWNRLPLLENSLSWYQAIMPVARENAARQGYAGVRWPKMVGPDGCESPSDIGPLLIWQQPHPIYYAELCYRARADRATLIRYKDLVLETAAFMASYACWIKEQNRYVLGPPLIPAQELYDPRNTLNPAFELQYWAWGLHTAQTWRERLGLKRQAQWDHVMAHLAVLPADQDTYLTVERDWVTRDHPSVLAARGMLSGSMVDPDTMRRTLFRVMKEWDWESAWGWDFPMTAMTAARVGESDVAMDALMMACGKNRYLLNGHNYQTAALPVYLPGNGGLLAAVAMLAAGWEGAPEKPAPGFPANGRWTVLWEHLNPML